MAGGQTVTPPFFRSETMNPLVLFHIEPKKCLQVPTPWGLYGTEWDKRLCRLYTFSAILAMLVVFVTLVTRGTHSEGGELVCCDNICLLRYEATFCAICSLAEGRSKPVAKTRNDCVHQ